VNRALTNLLAHPLRGFLVGLKNGRSHGGVSNFWKSGVPTCREGIKALYREGNYVSKPFWSDPVFVDR
jgi:hypothetical protein